MQQDLSPSLYNLHFNFHKDVLWFSFHSLSIYELSRAYISFGYYKFELNIRRWICSSVTSRDQQLQSDRIYQPLCASLAWVGEAVAW